MGSNDFVARYLQLTKEARLPEQGRANLSSGAGGVLLVLNELADMGHVERDALAPWTAACERWCEDEAGYVGPSGHPQRDGFVYGRLGALYALAYSSPSSDAAASYVERFLELGEQIVADGLTEMHSGSAGVAIASVNLAHRCKNWGGMAERIWPLASRARVRTIESLRVPIADRADPNLSFAHGATGELYAAFTSPGALPPFLMDRLEELAAAAVLEGAFAAWPIALGGPVPSDMWFSVCNGVPGQLMLWTCVLDRTSLADYASLALACAQSTARLLHPLYTLCCGLPGQVSALSEYQRVSGCQQFTRIMRDRVRRSCMHGTSLGPSLYHGQGGIAWCVTHLAKRLSLAHPHLSCSWKLADDPA